MSIKPNDPRIRVHAYTVVPTGYDDFVFSDKAMWTIEVRDGGSEYGWAVARIGSALSSDGTWDYEPIPSSRDDEYLQTHRFPLDRALALALEHVDGVVLNGVTAAQADASVRARLAETGGAR